MSTILHPNAKTMPKIREEIFNSKESLTKIAKKYNLNIKTVTKWKKRGSFEDYPSGAIKIKSVLRPLHKSTQTHQSSKITPI